MESMCARASLLVALATIALMPLKAAQAAWTIAFEPDQTTFRCADVVTGKMRIRQDSQALATCKLVRYRISGPGGAEVEVIERGRFEQFDARQIPLALGSGEELVRAVCLLKWDGRFVFADEGRYRITVSVTFADVATGALESADAAPCVVQVVRAGDVPQAYIDCFSDRPNIVGCFRYGLACCSVLDLEKLQFGEYDESLYAYMNYQAWMVSLGPLLFPISEPVVGRAVVEDGQALARFRLGGRECRGHWIYERFAAMKKTRNQGRVAHSDRFHAGDIAY